MPFGRVRFDVEVLFKPDKRYERDNPVLFGLETFIRQEI
jgi:hypothetical protein